MTVTPIRFEQPVEMDIHICLFEISHIMRISVVMILGVEFYQTDKLFSIAAKIGKIASPSRARIYGEDEACKYDNDEREN